MSADKKKTLPRIRTFALDLEHERQKTGHTVTDETQKHEPAAAPVFAAAPKARAASPTSEPTSAPVAISSKDTAVSSEVSTLQTEILKHVTPTLPTAPTQKKIVVRAHKQPLKKESHVSGGTVITDTKRGKFKLIPAILASIDVWIKRIDTYFKTKPAPTYTVTDTEIRKGVIQKATTKTGAIFTADNETLKEEIRRRKQQTKLSEGATEPEVLWSPHTESGYPLLTSAERQPVISNVAVAFKKRSVPEPVFIEPTTSPEIIPEPAERIETPVPLPEETETSFATPTWQEVAVPEPIPEPVPPPQVIAVPVVPKPTLPWESAPTPVLETPTFEAPTEIPPTPAAPPQIPSPSIDEFTTPEAHYSIKTIGDITKINTNILAMGVVGVIAAIIILIVLLKVIIGFLLPDTPGSSVSEATPITAHASVVDLPIEVLSTEGLLSALQKTSSGDVGVNELRLVNQDGIPLATPTLTTLFGFRSNQTLSQSIESIHLATIGSKRALVFTVSDATSAFGSLLAWEPSMVQELGGSLGIPLPDSKGTFSDQTILTTDVRILTVDGNQVLVYGFSDKNTVVITTDVPTFSAVLGRN